MRPKFRHLRSLLRVTLLGVPGLVLVAVLLPALAFAGAPPDSCCTEDGRCRLFIVAGPENDTYANAALRIKTLLEQFPPPGVTFDTKVLVRHHDGQALRGSAHNILYLLRLSGLAAATDIAAPGEPGDTEVPFDTLLAEDLSYTRRCTLAMTQADVASIAVSGALQEEMMRERFRLESSSEETGWGLREFRMRYCGEDAPTAEPEGDQWIFSPGLICPDDSPAEVRDLHSSATGLRGVVSVFREPLHLVLRYPLAINDLSQLSELRVYPGPIGSGTRITSMHILNASGLRGTRPLPSELSDWLRDRDFPAAAAAMQEHDLDAFFSVSDPPMKIDSLDPDQVDRDEFEHLLRSGHAYITSLPTASILRLTEIFPLLSFVEIPAGTYPQQSEAVKTVAVQAMLVALSEFPPELIATIVETLVLHEDALRNREENGRTLPVRLGFSGLQAKGAGNPVPSSTDAAGTGDVRYHDGTLSFLAFRFPELSTDLAATSRSIRLEVWKLGYRFFYRWHEDEHIAMLFLFIAVLVVGFWSWPTSRVKIIRTINARPFTSFAAAMILLLLFAGTLTFLAESRRSDFFSNPAEAVFSVVVYLLSGFEDRAPTTAWGRLGSTTILIVSPLMIALLTGAVIRMVQHQGSEGYVILRRLKKHYVICGWNDRALGIILQLRDELLERLNEHYPIVVVGEPGAYLDFQEVKQRFPNFVHDVRFLRESPTDPAALTRAQIGKARAVVVLGDGDGDAHAAMVLATIKSVRNGWIPETRIWRLKLTRRLRVAASYLVVSVGWDRRGADSRGDGPAADGLSFTARARRLAARWEIGWRDPAIIVESVEDDGASDDHRPLDSVAMLGAHRAISSRFKVVRGHQLRSRTLAQSARVGNSGIVNALFEMLSYDLNSNEVHAVLASALFSRRRWRNLARIAGLANGGREPDAIPFREVVREFMRRATRTSYPMIVVGHRPAGTSRFVTNPLDPGDPADVGPLPGIVRYGDELLVLGYRSPRKTWRRMQ